MREQRLERRLQVVYLLGCGVYSAHGGGKNLIIKTLH